jgi:toxin HigB-1
MIQGFACDLTKRLFLEGYSAAQWRSIKRVALRKLDMLDAAIGLSDLRSPPGNRLEKLQGDRSGQHSIRINDKYRVCFIWTPQGPSRVEIADYH